MLWTKVHALWRVAVVAVVSDTRSLVVSRAVNVLKGQINPSQSDSSWDDDSAFDQGKKKDDFRQYDEACDRVKEFYREQHGTSPLLSGNRRSPHTGRSNAEKQTVAYNLRIREEFKRTVRARMGIWEAMEKLSELVDDSDPDVGVPSEFHILFSPLSPFNGSLLFCFQCTCAGRSPVSFILETRSVASATLNILPALPAVSTPQFRLGGSLISCAFFFLHNSPRRPSLRLSTFCKLRKPSDATESRNGCK